MIKVKFNIDKLNIDEELVPSRKIVKEALRNIVTEEIIVIDLKFKEKILELTKLAPSTIRSSLSDLKKLGYYKHLSRVHNRNAYLEHEVKSKEYLRLARIKSVYKIDINLYLDLLNKQNNKCAICNKPETITTKNGDIKNLAVDHCHKTGKVRGLLCSKCNVSIGNFEDNLEVIKNAYYYIANNI